MEGYVNLFGQAHFGSVAVGRHFNSIGNFAFGLQYASYGRFEGYDENDPSGTYATHIDGHGYALSGEGVYSKQFGTTTLRTGLQYQHNFAENDYTLYNTTSAMTKDNAYLYAEVQGSIGSSIGYSIGTGAKLLNVTDGTNSQSYLRNLSTARLNWRATDNLSLTAFVQYTPMLPTLAALSPVFQQTDDVEGTSA